MYTTEEEVYGARWLSKSIESIEHFHIWANYDTSSSKAHALTSYGMIPLEKVALLDSTTQGVESGAYVYLSYLNVVEGIGVTVLKTPLKEREPFNMAVLRQILMGVNKIYTNNGIEILLKP